MALTTYKPGGYYGIIPGSKDAGGVHDPRYQGVIGYIEPGEGTDLEAADHRTQMWAQQDQDRTRRNRYLDDLIGQINGRNSIGPKSSYNFQSWGQPIPAPTWASTAGVWSQGQINQQANQQRAQLFAQAANQQRGYSTKAAQAGFSPMSPLTQFMGQAANQRAGAAAAANETNLNWNAALGNREASQRGESINAGLYGNYTNALARQREMAMQGQSQQFNQRLQQQQLLASLIGKM